MEETNNDFPVEVPQTAPVNTASTTVEKKEANKEDPKTGKNITMAVVAYILFFVPLLTDSKNDPFVKFHVKQGLVIFISSVVVGIMSSVFPYTMWLSLGWILNLAILVLFVLGIINALNGKEEYLPVVGKLADKFKF